MSASSSDTADFSAWTTRRISYLLEDYRDRHAEAVRRHWVGEMILYQRWISAMETELYRRRAQSII